MPMKKVVPAESADAYVASLSGWQRRYSEALRSAVLSAAPLREAIKWGHLVYFSNGPVLLPGGKYEMATLELVENTPLERSTVVELVKRAVALNASHGDPWLDIS